MEYTYDLFDRRIARKVDADGNGLFETTQRFVYDGDDLILAFSGSTNILTNRYLYGPATDEILADEKITTGTAGAVTWSLGDNLGTIRDLVQYNAATGTTTVVNHVRYDTFGQIVGQTNSTYQPFFAYTGREWDPAVGLYFYRARWYDPRAGRFTSEDPLGFAAGDVNLSRYVGNAATLWVDPSGLQPTTSGVSLDPAAYQGMMEAMSRQTGWNGFAPSMWDKAQAAMKAEWDTAKAMVMNPFASLGGCGHAFASGMVSDSLQGMTAQVVDMVTFNYFDLTSGTPKYGHQQAFQQGQWIGWATVIAEELALTYGAAAAIQAGRTAQWALRLSLPRVVQYGYLTADGLIMYGTSLAWVPAGTISGAAIGNALLFGGITVVAMSNGPSPSVHGHHPIPKFLGGDINQSLSKVSPEIHLEFHKWLRHYLREANIPLPVGGPGGSAADWARFMIANLGSQRKALDAVLRASRGIDAKHGLRITLDVWKNLMEGAFTLYP